MKNDFVVLFLLVVIGAFNKRMNWKTWLCVSAFIFVWMMFSWLNDKN